METPSGKPFLFEKSFDLAALKAAEAAKKVKTYTEEEVAKFKEQAYTAGMAAGREAAQREIQQQQTTALGHIARLFEKLAGDVWNVYAQQKQVATEIAVTIARKILPDYTRRHGMEEMTAAIESCVTEMINEPRLVLRVNEQQFDYIKREIDAMAERLGYAGKMIILADAELGEHDCRLEWADGGMERNTNVVWSEVDRQIARHGGGPGPATSPHPGQPAAPRGTEAQAPTTTIAV